MSAAWRRLVVPLSVVCACVWATGASGEVRFRTPAEIELRRAAIAERLVLVAEEQGSLEVQLADARRTRAFDEIRAAIEARLAELSSEREALAAEARALADVRTRTATGPLSRGDSQGLSPAQIPGGSGQVSAGTAFNPAITVIPDALYHYANRAGGVPRGFSLREVEIAFSGAVDPYFDVWSTFGVGEGEIEPEEVYVQTRRFLPGAQARFGRFFSGVGHLNRQHRHQWDYVDRPLPYEALLGSQVAEVGLQLTWLPAIPIYTQLGVEALQGENALIANQLSGEYATLEEEPGPRLFTGFVKISPDLGFSHTLQAGVSAGRSRSHQEAEAFGDDVTLFDGETWFAGTDWIWRYDSASAFGRGDLAVQGEYFYRSKVLTSIAAADARASRSWQDGAYAQVVYGVAPRWTVGGRVDALGLLGDAHAHPTATTFGVTTRQAANVTFNPTEFSRLRVQYNVGRVPGERPARVHEVYVQFQMSLGVHGAHLF